MEILNNLKPEFKNSIINNFEKNIDYNVRRLYSNKYTNYQKKKFINGLISRIDGFEGDIILNYNIFSLLKFINKLNQFSNFNEKDDDMNCYINIIISRIMEHVNSKCYVKNNIK